MSCKTFLLTHTFKNISQLEDGESYNSAIETRYKIPWTLGIFKKEECLGLNLHCEKRECFGLNKWSLRTKFTMKLVSVSGKFFQRTLRHEFQKQEKHGIDKFISWENMLRDYVDNDSINIEVHVDILNSTGIFEQKYTPFLSLDCGKVFALKHAFKNISRFVEAEDDFSDVEEHFNIPWRLRVRKLDGSLVVYLKCERNVCKGRRLSIECEYQLKLFSASGKCHSVYYKSLFGGHLKWGRNNFIDWGEMERYFVDNDSIYVEAHVKIINITDYTCHAPNTESQFSLSHTIRNMSSIEEGGEYFTDIQNRSNIPWKLHIRRLDGFIGLYLRCEKELCESRLWSIETEYQIRLVSPNGRSLSFKTAYVFTEPFGFGWDKIMRWDSLKEKYMINDTLIVEAHVRIIETSENEDPVEGLPGFAIPVGDQEYSMEKWLEVAFDH